jgi:hypothetical protein
VRITDRYNRSLPASGDGLSLPEQKYDITRYRRGYNVKDMEMGMCEGPEMAHRAFEALRWIELKFDLPWEYSESTRHHTDSFSNAPRSELQR